MKLRLTTLVALALLLAAGCRSNGKQELLEQESRTQEDQIYQLQDQLKDTERQLESCRRENAALKKEAHGPVGDVPSGNDSPKGNDSTIPPLPKIDPGTPTPPSGTGSGLETPKSADAPPSDSPAPLAAAPAGTPTTFPPDDPTGIQRIAINPILTGPHSFGSRPGDDGVQVIFAPRDASNRPLNAPGSVAIVVIDPELSGAAARVARWDFTAEEAAAHYQQTALAKGFRFQFVWPNQPPEHDKLRLFVRFVTPDGHKFEAEHTLHLGSRSAATHSWSQPTTIQQWEPSNAPLGAQFDPESAPPPAAARAPTSVMAPANPRTSAPSANGRPTWSPYR